MMTQEENLAVLETAIAKVRKGWAQGGLAYTRDGRLLEAGEDFENACNVCLVGALCYALRKHNLVKLSSADESFRRALTHVIGPRFLLWNDKPGRTQEDVIKVLTTARSLVKRKVYS